MVRHTVLLTTTLIALVFGSLHGISLSGSHVAAAGDGWVGEIDGGHAVADVLGTLPLNANPPTITLDPGQTGTSTITSQTSP